MHDVEIGLLALMVSVVAFGSNYVPMVGINVNDGMFFILIYALSIFMVTFVFHLFQPSPFMLVAMAGGMIWGTGNLLIIHVIQCIGITMAMLIWGSVAMISGWAAAMFGFMGIKKEVHFIDNVPLNVCGIALALTSVVLTSMIQSTNTEAGPPNNKRNERTDVRGTNDPIDTSDANDKSGGKSRSSRYSCGSSNSSIENESGKSNRDSFSCNSNRPHKDGTKNDKDTDQSDGHNIYIPPTLADVHLSNNAEAKKSYNEGSTSTNNNNNNNNNINLNGDSKSGDKTSDGGHIDHGLHCSTVSKGNEDCAAQERNTQGGHGPHRSGGGSELRERLLNGREEHTAAYTEQNQPHTQDARQDGHDGTRDRDLNGRAASRSISETHTTHRTYTAHARSTTVAHSRTIDMRGADSAGGKNNQSGAVCNGNTSHDHTGGVVAGDDGTDDVEDVYNVGESRTRRRSESDMQAYIYEHGSIYSVPALRKVRSHSMYSNHSNHSIKSDSSNKNLRDYYGKISHADNSRSKSVSIFDLPGRGGVIGGRASPVSLRRHGGSIGGSTNCSHCNSPVRMPVAVHPMYQHMHQHQVDVKREWVNNLPPLDLHEHADRLAYMDHDDDDDGANTRSFRSNHHASISSAEGVRNDENNVHALRGNKVFGVCGAALAGTLIGLNFNPIQYCKEKIPGASQNDTDYAFSHASGILLSSFLYFLVYSLYKQHTGGLPWVSPQLILPSIAAGAMWAVGQLMYFYSNEHLEYVVSFPLMQLGPGVIGAFYGVFYFKEVKGAQNLALLGLVFFLAILAALMIVWSRV